LTKTKVPSRASPLLARLVSRFQFCVLQRVGNQPWAGCSSEGNPAEDHVNSTAYVAEPRIKARSLRDLRALVLVLVNEQLSDDPYLVFTAIWDKLEKRTDRSYEKLKVSLQFLMDRRFNVNQPTQEAVNLMLGYHPRSYTGNDLERGLSILKATLVSIRALQRSKAVTGLPQRPKERAEPTHEWLPSWQQQARTDDDNPDPTGDPIWELLSPVEVVYHLSR